MHVVVAIVRGTKPTKDRQKQESFMTDLALFKINGKNGSGYRIVSREWRIIRLTAVVIFPLLCAGLRTTPRQDAHCRCSPG
jgi:hypothetical protein